MDSSQIVDTDEQLRGWQNDEFKALKECFADQLVDLRKLSKVSKNPKKRKRDKLWIPIELSVKIETRPEPIAYFDLHIKCTRKYPLVPPAIGFRNIKGIGRRLITKLHKQLKQETASDEHKGQGCIALLIMRAQQFLEDHYTDLELNNKSFYDQMVDQKQTSDRDTGNSKRVQDEMDKLERDRQVEEIRQKIIRKRELYNERKTRRDSQNSNVENEVEDLIYDYDGDLDADGTTASLTDDGDTISRLKDLEEEEEEDTTIVDKRAPTAVTFPKESKSFDEHGSLTRESSIQSRVDLEYEVIEELGHGGFGTVYKVRNRVDSRLYALKKVKLNPDNEALNERIMREVRLLSRLNHENVIRYYTAWNESEAHEVPDVGRRKSNSDVNVEESAYKSTNMNQESCILSQQDMSQSSDDESNEVYHTSYLINDKNLRLGENSASYVVFDTNDNKDENEIVESMKKALGPKLSDDESDYEVDNQKSNASSKKLKINRWLYIQMELGQGTLREAIDGGLPRNKDRARRFFREILDGLCHIHRQGIIHRDLKPVNIFLDSMDRPKIGDFGLATTNLFIVTQNNSPGVHTATAIKPNRMSLEKLRLLATPEQGNSVTTEELGSRSGERLKYIQYNQTDNIGTPLYMSPELSATNSGTRIAKVVYSHKVDVYSLGIIYFEMLYPFATGHERIIILQDLRKKSIKMPTDVESNLSREDIELIKLLLTHEVATRPTSEKLLTSNLLPSVGLKERESQNMIKQIVQNPQARTHKLMLRLLFEQNDSYVDDFVFDFEDVDYPNSIPATPTKTEAQQLLKDFNTKTIILDQVKQRLELLMISRGFIQYSTPTLMPKYSASKYYSRQQIDDVVMLMDKNSSILTLPYDLRLPFARNIARTNINYMNRYSIEKIFRQRQILGYHPDQLWECCLDIVTPPLPTGLNLQAADAEILNLMSDVIRALPMLYNLQPSIKLNDIRLVRTLVSLVLHITNNKLISPKSSSISSASILASQKDQIDSILSCISESLNLSLKKVQVPNNSANSHNSNQTQNLTNISSLPVHVKEDLKRDLVANKLLSHTSHATILISFLDSTASKPCDLFSQYEQLINRYNSRQANISNTIINVLLEEIRNLIQIMEQLVLYSTGLGMDLPLRISAGFVLNALRPVNFYSGMVCLLECSRYSKIKIGNKSGSSTNQHKSVILAVGGRYDSLIEKFSRNRHEVFDRMRSVDANTSTMEGSSGGVLSTSLNSADNRDICSKTAVGVSFEVEKFARFVLEDYVEKFVSGRDVSICTPSLQQLSKLNISLGSPTPNARWQWGHSNIYQNSSNTPLTQLPLHSPNNHTQSSSVNLDTSIASSSQQQIQYQQQLLSNNHSPGAILGNISSQTTSSFAGGSGYNCPTNTFAPLTGALHVRYWPIDLAICTLAHPKTKPQIVIISNIIRQLRDKGLMCNEYLPNEFTSFTMHALSLLCKENRIPYILAVKFTQQLHNNNDFNQQQSNVHISVTSSTSSIVGVPGFDDSSISSTQSNSPTASPTTKVDRDQVLLTQSLGTLTLYQWEKLGRLRPIKHCDDAQSMINYLVKKY